MNDWSPFGSVEIRTIVAAEVGVAPEAVGLLLDPATDEVVGVMPGSPAAAAGIDVAAKAAGLPINERRIRELAQLAADAAAIGALRWFGGKPL